MDFSYLDDWLDEDTGAPQAEDMGEGFRHVFALVETVGDIPNPASIEAVEQARQLADQIGVYAYAVLACGGADRLGQELIACGADRVLLVTDLAISAPAYQPEASVALLAELVDRYRPEILLMAATPLGCDLAPRLAQRLETGLISNCLRLEIDMSERLLLGTFAIIGGEVHHTVACPEARPQMATLLPGRFGSPYRDEHRSGRVETVTLECDSTGLPTTLAWLETDARISLPPAPLATAPIVVSAGRGMADGEGFALVKELAKRLGGRLVGSRGAYDEGWIGEEQIVGIGGESIHPDLYVACGVSGGIYHYFGVQDSKFIVSINSDQNAPINRVANMAILADARQFIPALLEALAE